MAGCGLCDAISAANERKDPYFVAATKSGYIRLHPNQFYRGMTLFISRECVPELHDLGVAERSLYLEEMAEVAHSVYTAFAPRKLNYELLGNGAPHLHWWLIPRSDEDSRPRSAIWENLDFLQSLWTEQRISARERDLVKERLLQELERAPLELVR